MSGDRTITQRLSAIEADVVTIKQQLAELLAILRPDPTPPLTSAVAADIEGLINGLFDNEPFELEIIDGRIVRK
jgi:hypothetical protein